MKACVLFLVLLTTNLFAQQNPSSAERDRISTENQKRRAQELDNYRKSHKGYAYTPEYLAFEEKLVIQEFEDNKKMNQEICDKFKGSNCIHINESHQQADERKKIYDIGRIKLEYQTFHSEKEKKIKPLDRDKKIDASWLDFLKRECEEFKSKSDCTTFEKYKTKYEDKYKDKYSSIKKEEVKTEGVSTKEGTVPAEITKTEEAVIIKKEAESAEDPSNYKADTCVWSDDIPRKIVTGPDCSKAGSKICVGYVVCEQKEGSGRFVRMSTCSSTKCGELDAAACTKQGGYSSRHPKDEDKETVTNRLKDVMTKPGKVISQ
jgi:hypothetical protein